MSNNKAMELKELVVSRQKLKDYINNTFTSNGFPGVKKSFKDIINNIDKDDAKEMTINFVNDNIKLLQT